MLGTPLLWIFIEGLPKSKSFDTILVVIDKLTKYTHFICLAHPYTALSVAQAFLANVYKLHGMPSIIISNRDKIFTSALWQELFRLIETTLNMSSAYHPVDVLSPATRHGGTWGGDLFGGVSAYVGTRW